MYKNGLMAFCTFYDSEPKREDSMCLLRFKLKGDHDHLVKEFNITLHPNSMFLMPLETNRMYTHDISPSRMNVSDTPTRLGYVIRSSNVIAKHIDGKTYINGKELRKPTPEDRKEIKDLYMLENSTTDIVNYPEILYSLNDGDYLKPNV